MKLHKLLASKPPAPKNAAIRCAGGAAHIYLYDVIGADWGMSALQFLQQVTAAKNEDATSITLHINSPGGDVFEAAAMGAALDASGLPVTAVIDGLCASAATTLSLRAQRVEMHDGSMYMIHNSCSIAGGDKGEMAKVGALLSKIDDQIIAGYAQKTGITADEIAAMMDAETWLTAQEAKDKGFVDAILGKASTSNQWDLSAFAKAPKQVKDGVSQCEMKRQVQINQNRLALLAHGPRTSVT